MKKRTLRLGRLVACIMMLWSVTIAALFLLAGLPSQAQAQSSSAFAGWVSLVTTPVGAFAPSVYVAPPPTAERRWGAQARYGHWQFASDDDNTTNLGIGAAFTAGDGRLSVEVGRTTKKDCSDCDAYLVGSELHLPLVATEGGIAVTLNPEVGFMNESGNSDFSAFAAAVNVLLSYPVTAGSNTRVVPFVSPGVGFGRVSGGGSSETGQRIIVGGGAAFVNVESGLQLTASLSKIIIDDGATVFGIALGYGR